MCSILAILDIPGDADAYRARALRLSRLQRHRGPDWSGVDVCPGGVLVHERLAIVDPASGAQPLYGPGNRTVLAKGGRRVAVNNQAIVHQLLAAHAMTKIETVYGTVFENILGEKVSTKPVNVVSPFSWVDKAGNRLTR